MRLTDQERNMGILIVTCKCCSNVYKAHEMSNACAYSLIPNLGCRACQGINSGEDDAKRQRRGLNI